mmetsp:Transcript_2956/g.7714  ORF Transcript_2956/g.7714 Transcript_2956/m.7714 type:complete len:268 (-) Transcript_2956:366-1169(-)|eukprot:CAMPEP_0202358768 /NCGR_PEP_ID=MMETSP1126-20121109/12318_1 /ASSEMBLY_ACC=CAM_ASM_000457 /TAXON_ID=3047 /ORGANISM="Dunaliella tertiolecta, Strain CCMP1320" /LENGTH=267 /DNA_ID=CAMNT_0048952025 /DNA_START=85 /DNA_END=888 /DNA_ORIENTATION=-
MASPSPASSRAVARLYRALLNYGKKMGPNFAVKANPAGRPWGTHVFSETGPAYQGMLLGRLVPSLQPPNEMINADNFKRIVRDRFREPLEGKPGGLPASLDEGFHALRVLGEQMYLNQCSSSQTTEGVQVDVTSSFDRAGMLGAGQPRYLFSYLVRIINNRDHPVQVLGRSWTMTNEYNARLGHIPLGTNSVVGQQPILPPRASKCFEYTSGTDCNTATGMQVGALLVHAHDDGMERPATSVIQASIAPFPLMVPYSKLKRQQEDPE